MFLVLVHHPLAIMAAVSLCQLFDLGTVLHFHFLDTLCTIFTEKIFVLGMTSRLLHLLNPA